jgi:gamma-glutamyltranspeptidase
VEKAPSSLVQRTQLEQGQQEFTNNLAMIAKTVAGGNSLEALSPETIQKTIEFARRSYTSRTGQQPEPDFMTIDVETVKKPTGNSTVFVVIDLHDKTLAVFPDPKIGQDLSTIDGRTEIYVPPENKTTSVDVVYQKAAQGIMEMLESMRDQQQPIKPPSGLTRT